MNTVFAARMPIRFQDVDAAGIVFFARVFDYAHDTFVAYLKHVDLPLDRLLREGTLGLPLVHAEADYQGSLRFGDDVDVAIARPDVGETSIKLTFALTVGGQPRAHVRVTHVAVEMATMKPVRVPDGWRETLR